VNSRIARITSTISSTALNSMSKMNTGSCPAVRTTARRVTWSGGLDRWVGLSAPTGWTAGAHVPAIQLSSLPLDEWHYMRHNETVRVRLRPAR
jgi:hypothetical protein